LEPGTPLIDEWYIDAIAEHWQAWFEGEIEKLFIHLRGRMGKSLEVSVSPITWAWTTRPTEKFLCSSYSQDLCNDQALKIRALISSPEYQALWPIQWAPDQNRLSALLNTDGGHRVGVLYGKGGTGWGGKYRILDDAQCGADMLSPKGLTDDYNWYENTWSTRANDGDSGPEIFACHRLGPWDLANEIRINYPQWECLGLQSRKTLIPVATYFNLGHDGNVKEIEMPLVDTALSRDGRFTDPRETGELLSSRISSVSLDESNASAGKLQRIAAQDQQGPLLATGEGAKVYRFDRKVHIKSFAKFMGSETLADACLKAMGQGWFVKTSWDHGLDGNREICGIFMMHRFLKKIWLVGYYSNRERSDLQTHADDVLALLGERRIVPLAVVASVGDVWTTTAGLRATPTTINAILSGMCGFPIMAPWKGAGSIQQGTDLLNMGFGGGSFFIDESCSAIAVSLEGWTGKEAHKDACDMLRYGTFPELSVWALQQSGTMGSSSC
jgi:hypothetical protein